MCPGTTPVPDRDRPAAYSGPTTAMSDTIIEPWFVRSRFFDPAIMSAVVLQSYQSDLLDQEVPSSYLQANELGFSSQTFDSLSTPSERDQFKTNLEETTHGTSILFVKHTCKHLSLETVSTERDGSRTLIIGLNRDAFRWLCEHVKIHPAFLESLQSQSGGFAMFTTLDNKNKPSYLHLCIKVAPVAKLAAAFYIQYDCAAQKTTAVVAGNDLNDQIKLIADALQRNGPFQDPFALAGLLATQYYRFLEAQSIKVDHAVIMMEIETGRGTSAYSSRLATQAAALNMLDLPSMHRIESDLRDIVYAAESQVDLVEFLIQEHMQYSQQRNGIQGEHDMLTSVELAVHNSLKARKTFVEGLLLSSRNVGHRLDRCLDAAEKMVTRGYSQSALSSAETSIQSAKQSNQLAKEMKRDSASMKIMGLLTMLFLPANFTTTVFGTNFVYSRTDDPYVHRDYYISSQIWKLVVVTVALIGLTLAVWTWLNRFGIPRLLDWARQSTGKDKEV